MPARFAIINGIAGTGVQQALGRYADWCSRNHITSPSIISLEDDYLLPLAKGYFPTVHSPFQPADVTIMEVLRLPKPLLDDLWSRAFNSAIEAVQETRDSERPVILTFHAVWFHLGVREYVSGIDFNILSGLSARPDIVFTFVDDIYDVKARLSEPNGIFSHHVASSDDYLLAILKLLQILDWRNTENVLASKVAEVLDAQHYVLAVKHPISVFHDLFSGRDKKLVYVAHPISEIRRLRQGTLGDRRLAGEIVERVQDLCRRLREHFIVFEPTAIDEFRFDVNFDDEGKSLDLPILGWRWPLPSSEISDLLFEQPGESDDAFGQGWTKLSADIGQKSPESLEESHKEVIRRAWPLLSALQQQLLNQITSRDFSLVTQADGLAVYRPAFRGHESSGVRSEITHHGILQQVGLPRATAVILHTEEDENDSILSKFKLHLNDWRSRGTLLGQPSHFQSMMSSLTVDHLKPIHDANTPLRKGQAISELLRQFSMSFSTPPARAMAADSSAVAREEESGRGSLFMGLRSYLSELEGRDDVEVIRSDLSVQDFVQRVVDLIDNRT